MPAGVVLDATARNVRRANWLTAVTGVRVTARRVTETEHPLIESFWHSGFS